MNDIKSAESLLVGLQLVVENSENVVNSSLCSGKMKMILKNLANRSENLINEFWSNMDEEAELYFQEKVKKCEKIINEI